MYLQIFNWFHNRYLCIGQNGTNYILWSSGLPINTFLVGAMAVSTSHFLHTSNLTVMGQKRHGIGEYRTGIHEKYRWSTSIPILWTRMWAGIHAHLDIFSNTIYRTGWNVSVQNNIAFIPFSLDHSWFKESIVHFFEPEGNINKGHAEVWFRTST